MPSTHDSSPAATTAEGSPVLPLSLGDAFAAVPDPRARQGRRFTLAALLTLALSAMLANHLSPLAIAQWGAEQDAASKRAMGFAKGVTPHQSTVARLFHRLDPALRSAALTAHDRAQIAPTPWSRGAEGIALDGKASVGYSPARRLRAARCTPSPPARMHRASCSRRQRSLAMRRKRKPN